MTVVTVFGILNGEVWKLATFFIEDGEGIARLAKFIESEKDSWDYLNYEFVITQE